MAAVALFSHRCWLRSGARAHEKSEDPIFVLEHDVPIDTQYYLQVRLGFVYRSSYVSWLCFGLIRRVAESAAAAADAYFRAHSRRGAAQEPLLYVASPCLMPEPYRPMLSCHCLLTRWVAACSRRAHAQDEGDALGRGRHHEVHRQARDMHRLQSAARQAP